MSGRYGIVCSIGKGVSVGLDRGIERKRILDSFSVLNVPVDIQTLIIEALDSPKWDWFNDCDGCTGVSEVFWPTIYFPPCLRHDFDCKIGQNNWRTSLRFYRIQRTYGMDMVRAGARAIGVTVAWYLCLKWKQRQNFVHFFC